MFAQKLYPLLLSGQFWYNIYREMTGNQTRIDCFKCKLFYITWDNRFPYGCKAMNFKSRVMPSIEVYKASGTRCLKFDKKA